MGDGCVTADDISFCIDHGVTKFRVNLAAEWGRVNARIVRDRLARHASAVTGVNIVWDLPFPNKKPRYYTYQGKRYDVKRGDSLELITTASPQTSPRELAVPQTFYDHIHTGDRLIVGDGETALLVDSLEGEHRIACTVTDDWFISDGKSLTIEKRENLIPSGEGDLRSKAFDALPRSSEFACSFVRSRSDVARCREKLPEDAVIMSKIETAVGVQNIVEIVQHSDSVMIARGDLALNIGFGAVGRAQACIIAECKSAGKPVFVATELLSSLSFRAAPIRAEVSDIYNLATMIDKGGFFLTKESSMPDMLRKSLPLVRDIVLDAGCLNF